MLALSGATAAVFALYRLRPPMAPARSSQHEQQQPSQQSG